MKKDTNDRRRHASPEVTIKQEEPSLPLSPASCASTGSPPLTTWPYSALSGTTHSLVTPSQLVLTGFIKGPSPSLPENPVAPRSKRTKRKAKTEEEKEARAYERTMRNRRAAQESRDRRKRQFEALEQENRRLQEENLRMKERIEQLEKQQQQFALLVDQTHPSPTDTSLERVVKLESYSPQLFESTFHPAVMEYDLQCLHSTFVQNLSILMRYRDSCPLSLQTIMIIAFLPPLFSTVFSLTMRTFLMNEMSPYLPATFNSLNTGSLFTGADHGLCGVLCH